MTLVDLIVLLIIAGLAVMALKKVLKDHAEGRCTGCGGNCGSCCGCHSATDKGSERIKKDLKT